MAALLRKRKRRLMKAAAKAISLESSGTCENGGGWLNNGAISAAAKRQTKWKLAAGVRSGGSWTSKTSGMASAASRNINGENGEMAMAKPA